VELDLFLTLADNTDDKNGSVFADRLQKGVNFNFDLY
jgi:hypothetical protein